MPVVDFSDYSPATLIQKAVEALTPDIPRLNEVEIKRYQEKEIQAWKLNRDAGHPGPIPEPPLAYTLKVDGFNVGIVRGAEPVCPKYVDPGTPEVPLVVAIGAAILGWPGRYERGYNEARQPDNAPDGYLYKPFGPGGPVFEKVIEQGFFGGTTHQYYKLVQ